MNRTSIRAVAQLAVAWGGLAVTAVALAQRPPAPPGRPCNAGNCVITVKVTDCQAVGGISVDPVTVVVSSARNMRWEISPKNLGFVFAANGIQFDPPNAQFQPKNSPKPDEIHIHNAKTQLGDFYYFVNVKQANGTSCKPLDPFVRNTN